MDGKGGRQGWRDVRCLCEVSLYATTVMVLLSYWRRASAAVSE